jgi:hypothetical protein
MPATVDGTIVGRGNADGARLFREWFAGLTAAAEAGRGSAYVFVMGSLAELLRTFDFPIVFPEINSLQTRAAGRTEYLAKPRVRYSPDICSSSGRRRDQLRGRPADEDPQAGSGSALPVTHQVGGDRAHTHAPSCSTTPARDAGLKPGPGDRTSRAIARTC